MKQIIHLDKRMTTIGVTSLVVVLAVVLLKFGIHHAVKSESLAGAGSASNGPPSEAAVELLPSQLSAIKIEPVATSLFPVEREAVGGIDFDEDLSVQVYPPYQGKILTTFSNLGDQVKQGQPLYTIDSPDLVQAESVLIGAAAAFDLTSKELARAKDLFGTNGVSEREVEQTASDQQTSEGALKAARDAVRLFGKSEAEIDQIAATRKIDPVLVVPSPVNGQVTARNAQAGLLVQPGSSPAPYSVADVTTKWMVANVAESDSPLFRAGQRVQTKVMALPGRVFEGKISRLGATVDPNTHRVMVRCDLADPANELRPGMLASFVIQVQAPLESVALPMSGVVRNGDGTMAAWVTTDRKRFEQRLIKVGSQLDGKYQVLEGLKREELAVTDGAIFLSNMLNAPTSD